MSLFACQRRSGLGGSVGARVIGMPTRWILAILLLPLLALECVGPVAATTIEWRSIDGSGNNLAHPERGQAGGTLRRRDNLVDYPGDGSGSEIVARANARQISNSLLSQKPARSGNARGMSDFVWIWGQFLDHDIDLTPSASASGAMIVAIPDPDNDPFGNTGFAINRSVFASDSGTPGVPRQQVNTITAFIDGSQVYGSDAERAMALRTGIDGMLKQGAHGLLPFNTFGLANGNSNPTLVDAELFVAGDVRANEQVGLTAMHTLFVREHNRLAALLAADPATAERAAAQALDQDEYIYQVARKLVGAELQIITYREFLPAILGPAAPAAAEFVYREDLDPQIANEFSTAFFRAHSLLSNALLLVEPDGTISGQLSLKDAFFNPAFLAGAPDNLERLLRGFARQPAQEFDLHIVDGVRNFLFGPPGAGGLDLGVLNIMRGRDHGLPDYNSLRLAYGLTPAGDFEAIACDPALAAAMEAVYGSVDSVDAWVGGLAECHIGGASVGELVATVMADQFMRLRDGDRFFYLNDPFLWETDLGGIIDLGEVSLARVILDNTTITSLQATLFSVSEPDTNALLLIGLVLALSLRRRRAG